MAKIVDIIKPFTIPIEYCDKPQHIKIYVYNSEESLRIAIKGRPGATGDAIAYTDTYTVEESPTLAARIYFVRGADIATIAHETTHLSLGILNRLGETTMPITADEAPAIEEKLCDLVGEITAYIQEDLSIHGSTQVTTAATTGSKQGQADENATELTNEGADDGI